MELIFNKIFVMKDIGVLYAFLISMVVMILIAIIFVLKELNKKDGNK